MTELFVGVAIGAILVALPVMVIGYPIYRLLSDIYDAVVLGKKSK